MEKKTKGRQKLEMKKINDTDALQVCFSKRRQGIFKKASELATLCGAKVAIVVYSPGGRAFTFGQPGVDAVADQFLRNGSDSGPKVNPNGIPDPVELHREVSVHHLNKRCMELSNQIAEQKKKREALEERLRMLASGPWDALARGHKGLQSLGLEDLEKMAKDLEDLKAKADARVREALNGAMGSLGRPLAVNSVKMVTPCGNEAANDSPDGFMQGDGAGLN